VAVASVAVSLARCLSLGVQEWRMRAIIQHREAAALVA